MAIAVDERGRVIDTGTPETGQLFGLEMDTSKMFNLNCAFRLDRLMIPAATALTAYLVAKGVIEGELWKVLLIAAGIGFATVLVVNAMDKTLTCEK